MSVMSDVMNTYRRRKEVLDRIEQMETYLSDAILYDNICKEEAKCLLTELVNLESELDDLETTIGAYPNC